MSSNCPEDEEIVIWDETTGFVGLVMFVLWFTVAPLGLFLFHRRRSHPYLRGRSFELNVISTIGLSLEFIVPAFTNYIGRDKFPCDVILSFTMMVLPIGVGPLAVRLVMFANRGEWQKSLQNTSMDEFNAAKFKTGSFTTELLGFITYKFRKVVYGTKEREVNDSQVASPDDDIGMEELESLDGRSTASRKAKFFLQSRFYGLLLQTFITLFALAMLTAAILEDGSPYGGKGCYGCEVDNKEFMYLLVLGILLYTFAVALIVLLRKRPDPLGIKREISLAVIIAGSLMLLGAILSTFDVGQMRESRSFDIYYLFNLGIFIGFWILIYQPLLESYRIDQNRLERRLSTASTLENALQPNTPLHAAFYDYLVTEWSIENALFLNAVDKFRNAQDDIAKKALDVYCTFIEPNSMLEVNISSSARRNVKEELEPMLNVLRHSERRNSGRTHASSGALSPDSIPLVTKDVFDEAYNEVYQLLYSDSWFRFKNSSKFEQVSKI